VGNRLRAFLTCENAFLTLIQGKVGCAQSIPHLEKPKNRRFSHKNPKTFDFRFNTSISSLNQGQGSVFTVRECAQSISRLEKPKNRRFSHKNLKMFDFRFNTPTTFPESGSGKRFQGSGMRAIDSSHKIRGSRVIFRKKFFLMISPNKRSSPFKYCLYCFLC
jgi:hypothetical protein